MGSSALLRLAGVASVLLLASCATFSPRPMQEVPFLERSVSQGRGGLTVTVAVPTNDEARSYLTEDLATADAIQKIGLVRGVGAATPEKPHRNLMRAPWWTDGMREVLLLSDEPVPLDPVDYFFWDSSAWEK